MTGRAVSVATIEMRQRMIDQAAQMMECATADLELVPGGAVGLVGIPKRVSFKDIALHSLFRSGGPIAATHGFVFDGPGFDPKRASIHRLAFANLGVYTFGAHCVEVDVDTATGAVAVRRAWCAHDVGHAGQRGGRRARAQRHRRRRRCCVSSGRRRTWADRRATSRSER